MSRNGTELGSDIIAHGQGLVLTVKLRRYELEVDIQALRVVYNLGLFRHHAHVRGITVALVVHYHGKFAGNHRLNCLGQRVVTVQVTLHEVCQIQLGRRFHCQGNRRQLARYLHIGKYIKVRECTTERIVDRTVGSSILGRNEHYCGNTHAVRTQIPAAVHVQVTLEVLQALGMHLELALRSHEARFLVGHVQLQLDIVQGTCIATVLNGQRAAECLTRHCHCLVDLQRNAGAYTAAVLLQMLLQLCKLLCYHVGNIGITGRTLTAEIPTHITCKLIVIIHGVQASLHLIEVYPVGRLCIGIGIPDALDKGVELLVGDVHRLVQAHAVGAERVGYYCIVQHHHQVLYLVFCRSLPPYHIAKELVKVLEFTVQIRLCICHPLSVEFQPPGRSRFMIGWQL